ncbi:MAG: RDD family protein [Erythrobacter sp.]|uniref:RDD family protein n=1 Tax=Erythrobacter sp. TaxID=1042 RepID=UPI0032EF4334
MNAATAPAPANGAPRPDPDAKRRRTLITPEGLALPVTVASRGARVGALVIDFIVIIVSIVLIQILFSLLFAGVLGETLEGLGGQVPAAGEFVVILAILLIFAARYGYFLAFELGPRGATPGKRAVGIRVAARTGPQGGGRLTPEAVIARNLIRDIELFMPFIFLLLAPSGEQGNAGIAGLVWFGIFMAFPFFNRDALRAGDVIAGTWVVEAPRTRLAEALSTQGAAAAEGTSDLTGARYRFGEAELSVYGERELQTLERILREDQPEALSAVHAAICRKIGWDPGAGDERAFLEAFYAQLRAKLESDMRFGKRKADKFS